VRGSWKNLAQTKTRILRNKSHCRGVSDDARQHARLVDCLRTQRLVSQDSTSNKDASEILINLNNHYELK